MSTPPIPTEENLMEMIEYADGTLLEEILDAVLCRFAKLYPQWEIVPVSILRNADRNVQIDNMTNLLNNMKNG